MATLIREIEGVPSAYPALTPFARELGTEVWEVAPNLMLAWARVEAWCGWRWSARSVAWVVEGPGDFLPRLEPFTLSTVELWDDASIWSAATAAPTPAGGVMLGDGVWRISGSVGAGPVPEAVAEAVRRLAEFNREVASAHMAETADYAIDGTQRPAAWAAKALQLSGAADLLRPWRRLGA